MSVAPSEPGAPATQSGPAQSGPAQFDKREVRRAFDRAARGYDAVAVLQREIGERMAGRLEYIKLRPETVLDAGSGTGVGLRRLRILYPDAGLIALDMALGMLRVARNSEPWWKRRLPFGAKTPAVCGDLECLPLKAASVDLIWSNLTLQWCDTPEAAFRECLRVLRPGGLLMFSTFGPDTLKELRAAFRAVDGTPHVSRFIDMHDIGDMLAHTGFAEPVMDMEMFTLTYAELGGLMRDLKALGAHNAALSRGRGLTGKSKWQALHDRYEAFRRDGLLPATFETVYGHAWKPQQARKTAEGLDVIRLDFKRAPR